ncbi:MAG: hypothetical protein QGH37_14470 [Candidatus Poribacteria bacterium]|nr:hypothetical protein [Candidatus Poribacteria bacterium]
MLHSQFHWPGQRELLNHQTKITAMIIGVSPQPMERAKKTAIRLQWPEKKTDTASPTSHQSTSLTNHLRSKVGYRFQSELQT